MEKNVLINGALKGKIMDEITLYLVEIDGVTHAYADLGNWIIGEVKDAESIEITDQELSKPEREEGLDF